MKFIVNDSSITEQDKPIIATFTSNIPSKEYLAPNTETALKFELQSVKLEEHREAIEYIVSENGPVVYKSETDGQNVSCTYYIGVRNKNTSEVEILPVSHAFSLAHQVDLHVKHSEQSSKSFFQANYDVTQTFASRKIQSLIKTSMANRVTLDSISDVASKGLVDRISKRADIVGDLTAAEETNNALPQYDPTAVNPADVYPLENIIPSELFGYLRGEDISLLVQSNGSTSACDDLISKYPRFVVNRVFKMSESRSPTKNAEMLLMMSYFIAFYRAARFSTPGKLIFDRLQDVMPAKIIRFLIDTYTVSAPGAKNNSIYTDFTKLRLSLAICILALHIDDFQTSPHSLGQDLSKSRDEILSHFRMVGCSIKNAKESNSGLGVFEEPLLGSIVLPTPLRLKSMNEPKQRRK